MLAAAVCAIIGATIDMRSNRIPNWLTYGALVLALGCRAALGGWRSLGQGIVGLLIGGGIFFVFFIVHGMGAGDVKLMAAVGAWVGQHQTVQVLIATAFAGGALAVFYMVFYKQVGRTFRNLASLLRHPLRYSGLPQEESGLQRPQSLRVPYGLAIALGTVFALLSVINTSGVIYGH